jgi:hypothetical protein
MKWIQGEGYVGVRKAQSVNHLEVSRYQGSSLVVIVLRVAFLIVVAATIYGTYSAI